MPYSETTMSDPSAKAAEAPPKPPPIPWPKLGTRLGAYVLKDLLGQGGMGRVYLASRSSSSRDQLEEDVALKVLDPNLAKKQMIRDFFLQEAELGQKLSHPNLVRFLDSGEIDGFFYLALEYIEGVSLDKLIKKKGPFEEDLALSVLEDVTFGLAAAHQNGIIHRDLKPQNVMITPENVIKIIDFGLAEADRGVGEGKTVGTPVYAAPEQNLGKKTDPSADVYSLGLMTYEMFSGTRLLPGGGLKKVIGQQVKLQKVLEKGISLNPRIPKPLFPILRKMLGFRPRERYSSAEELVPVLDQELPKATTRRSETLEKHKTQAVIELAENHYLKAAELAKAGKFLDAAQECTKMVRLRSPNLKTLQDSIRGVVIRISWEARFGGPIPAQETPPMPDLVGLEELSIMAASSELPDLKWLFQSRLERLARHYDPDYYRSLKARCYDNLPMMVAIAQDRRASLGDRIQFTVPLTWSYLALGYPEPALRVLEACRELDPGNPALAAAEQKIQEQLKKRDEGPLAIEILEKVLEAQPDTAARIEKVRQFVANNPLLLQAQDLQIREARRAGIRSLETEAQNAKGIRSLISGEHGLGLQYFAQALRLEPNRTDTHFYIVEALRFARRTVSLPADSSERALALYKILGLRFSEIQDYESKLTGTSADRETLRELASIAAEEAFHGRPDRYLVRLAALELSEGEKETAKTILEQAIGVSPQPADTARQIQAIPNIQQVFSRLDLARLAHGGR